ncbi:MAG TPA: glycosyltransferase family 2 protein [Bacteroidia bacterium]|nr:glycosyltransferase family 2 protein [Bacteroidia bacterium]
MMQLSAVIITFNEERNIERCLRSLVGVADEIVVVDSFSSDRTPEICKAFGVTFFQTDWKGFASTKNFANALASGDWILSMDADEALSDELKNSILKCKEQGKLITARFKRRSFYCGKWINHSGWYPDMKIRMFDRRQVIWTGTIHEQLQFSEHVEMVTLDGDLHHYSYYTIREHLLKSDKYSTLAAAAMFESGKKITMLMIPAKALARFLRVYFLNLGVLDGIYGLVICGISAWEVFLKYSRLYILLHNKPAAVNNGKHD